MPEGSDAVQGWRDGIDMYPSGPFRDQTARVTFDLRRRIESGEVGAEAELPSRTTLSGAYEVEPTVVLAAWSTLVGEKLLTLRGDTAVVRQGVVARAAPHGLSPLAKKLLSRIHSGELTPGTPIARSKVVEIHGVNRPAADAALRQLAHVGLLADNPNGWGWLVAGELGVATPIDRTARSVYRYSPKPSGAIPGGAVEEAVTRGIERYGRWADRLTKREQVAHVIGSLIAAGEIAADTKLTTGNIVRVFGVGKALADRAREDLVAAGMLTVQSVSAGSRVASDSYRLQAVVVDPELVDHWQATVDRYQGAENSMHEAVAYDLRRRVESGELRPATPLPAYVSLKAIYGVEDRTLRAALKHLVTEGALTGTENGFRVSSRIQLQEPPGLSPLARRMKRALDSGQLTLGGLSKSSLGDQFDAGPGSVGAAMRQLSHVGAWPRFGSREAAQVDSLSSRPAQPISHSTTGSSTHVSTTGRSDVPGRGRGRQ